MKFPKEYPINQFIKHLNLLCQHYEQGSPVGFAEVLLKKSLSSIEKKIRLIQAINDNKHVFSLFHYKIFPSIIIDSITQPIDSHTFNFQYQDKYNIQIEIISNKVHSIEIGSVLTLITPKA